MAEVIVHELAKRSWWDGSVTALCGERHPAGTYSECWFRGGITCPDCKAAKKAQKR